MERIVKVKFDQHDDLRRKLTDTQGHLYEATKDPYWGCGFFYRTVRTDRTEYTQGRNKLGQILVEVRQEYWEDENS